jgi:excinuclease UvrABC ATPase subunit
VWLEEMKAPAKTLQFLEQLEEIGLAHLSLEQPVQSLSSGEKQRLLLLNWLQERATGTLYILDEPSTGLHYADIDLLFAILKKLSENNDILIIDHNPYLLGKIEVGVVLE